MNVCRYEFIGIKNPMPKGQLTIEGKWTSCKWACEFICRKWKV